MPIKPIELKILLNYMKVFRQKCVCIDLDFYYT